MWTGRWIVDAGRFGVRWGFWPGLGTWGRLKGIHQQARGSWVLLAEAPAEAMPGDGNQIRNRPAWPREGARAHLHIGLVVTGLREDAGRRGGCQVPVLQARCASVCLQQCQEVLG